MKHNTVGEKSNFIRDIENHFIIYIISRRRYTTASLQRYSSSVGGGALHYVMYYIFRVSHYMHEEKAARRGVAWHRRCAKTVVKARTNVPRGVHKMHGEDRRKCEREKRRRKRKREKIEERAERRVRR